MVRVILFALTLLLVAGCATTTQVTAHFERLDGHERTGVSVSVRYP